MAHAAKLVNFQVAQPPIVPKDAKTCTVKILQRDFASSYGSPEIVQYTPPSDCGQAGSWSAVTLNFTVTSNGTQYDRLGIFTFQNVEIWRTSTPEPTKGDGIIWTHVKDVTQYTPLFAKPGTFILQLDNIVQTGLDGVYSTVLYATFYASSTAHPPAPKADLILPISNLKNDTGNDVSVPPSFSLNVTFPQNTARVFAELYASGNGEEEFWYYNSANKYLSSLPDGFLGNGPFREVRLLIDGRLAGATYPFAVLFTGAIVPPSWRPISAYGAIDLPTYFLDVTPFVPVLADGKPHNITIDVVSAEDNHAILQNWYLSGNFQVFLDESSKPTTGEITNYAADPYSKTNVAGVTKGSDVTITVGATRKLLIESTIVSGSGKVNKVVFSQDLTYKNVQVFLNNFGTQNVVQTASGVVSSTHNGVSALQDTFLYPLTINYTNLDSSGNSWRTNFNHSYVREVKPLPISLKTKIDSQQQASGYFFLSSSGNTGNGTNSNVFSYSDEGNNTYRRRVNASLNKITLDDVAGTLSSSAIPITPSGSVDASDPPNARLPPGRQIPGS
ncbi:peptide N-acetyl-beta-D-glucosaminyl asparaginase amidase A-domain-containing protein [Crepidotus variabilis]|uniref:Peptide N-acetyl-beta-D-glucosaminyl asparaginase amidase A-domain-containing protein n=1 Tax=Crepidotus variabilis TaxID=179855 RepID=A0A9P6JUL4_9AGAR|nr:peptide N-acetyl-beta-D-glucosaminyl asparaginase amidase A-domain-containing protein [Crepidotus variabilis]